MRIGFCLHHLDIRGTGVTLYNFARYSENILGHEAIILYDMYDEGTDDRAVELFKRRFGDNLYHVGKLKHERQLLPFNLDALYWLQTGPQLINNFPNTKLFNHIVGNFYYGQFRNPLHSFAYISDDLQKRVGRDKALPLIVELDSTQEKINEIDTENTLILGRHGGLKGFNVAAAQRAVKYFTGDERVKFLFLNTVKFTDQDNAIFMVDGSSDWKNKTRFINTCDAMIYGRKEGENFGLAIGEFAINGKPILLPNTGGGNAARYYLGNGSLSLPYHSEERLIEQIEWLYKIKMCGQMHLCFGPDSTYSKFSAAYVMQQFREQFDI